MGQREVAGSVRLGQWRRRSAWHKQCKNDPHSLHLYNGTRQFNLIDHHQLVPFHIEAFHMISLPPSPTFTPSRSISGRLHTENESPPLSPKRSFAQLEEDPLPQLELKRRDVQHSRRAPLDPLSASDLANRRDRDSQSTDSLHHTLVTPLPVPDLWVWHPEQPVSSGSCEMQRSGISDALVCSWPPPIPTPGTGLAGQQASQYSPDEKDSSRASFLKPTSTAWDPSDSFPTDPTTTMTKPIRTTGWKSENVLQPIRSRTNSMPSMRRPPGELWRSDPKANQEPVDTAPSLVYPTPSGLLPRQPELRRGSNLDLLPHGSVSLSLALGSQPLRASEHTKAVPPIGAERSRVISITPLKSHIQNSPGTQSHDPSKSFSPLSLGPRPKWKNETDLLNTTSPEKVQMVVGSASVSKGLLRQAVRNKYAPKIMSPLNPLRSGTPAIGLSANPEYQLRMPSQWNNPSPRYSRCPPRRARTICDAYQSFDWNTTCMHCPECKRDAIGKRLLAFRYRSQQTRLVQGNKLLADRIREVYAYEIGEEEKSLWEEVAAVTGAGPMSFSRAGAPCATATHLRVVDDGSSGGTYDDYLEIPEDNLLANESGHLFREVSVY
ncbi:hypothetical protein EV363DRAFT_1356541 [Boletus edulis]|nr:hypothetical protein EV363DRAFT_1356541 [Boletus edulis]